MWGSHSLSKNKKCTYNVTLYVLVKICSSREPHLRLQSSDLPQTKLYIIAWYTYQDTIETQKCCAGSLQRLSVPPICMCASSSRSINLTRLASLWNKTLSPTLLAGVHTEAISVTRTIAIRSDAQHQIYRTRILPFFLLKFASHVASIAYPQFYCRRVTQTILEISQNPRLIERNWGHICVSQLKYMKILRSHRTLATSFVGLCNLYKKLSCLTKIKLPLTSFEIRQTSILE